MTLLPLFLLAVLLDLLCGDPRWFPHPVKIIGWLCIKCETFFRSLYSQDKNTPKNLQYAGCYTTIIILSITGCSLLSLLLLCHSIHSWAEISCAVIFLYTAIAIKDLLAHSKRVYLSLQKEDLPKARKDIQMIVGRDTAQLDSREISRACIETVAENMADGIIAPLFWGLASAMLYTLLLANSSLSSLLFLQPISIAALGAMLYKACNTMDSMFGYKNKRYIDFGRCPARLDDIVNFIPARLSAVAIIAAAFVLRLESKNAFTICLRDCHNHSSPNAGYPEAAMAGALGIMLGGSSSYFGELVEKPTIGDKTREIVIEDILLANRIVLIGTFLSLCPYFFYSLFFYRFY